MDASASYTYYYTDANGQLVAAHGHIDGNGHIYHYTHPATYSNSGANNPGAASSYRYATTIDRARVVPRVRRKRRQPRHG